MSGFSVKENGLWVIGPGAGACVVAPGSCGCSQGPPCCNPPDSAAFSVPGITTNTALTVSISGSGRLRNFSSSGSLLQDETWTLPPTMQLICSGGVATSLPLPVFVAGVEFSPSANDGWLRVPHGAGRAMQIFAGGARGAIGALGGEQWTHNTPFAGFALSDAEPSRTHPTNGAVCSATVTVEANSIVSTMTTQFANGSVRIDDASFAISADVLACGGDSTGIGGAVLE